MAGALEWWMGPWEASCTHTGLTCLSVVDQVEPFISWTCDGEKKQRGAPGQTHLGCSWSTSASYTLEFTRTSQSLQKEHCFYISRQLFAEPYGGKVGTIVKRCCGLQSSDDVEHQNAHDAPQAKHSPSLDATQPNQTVSPPSAPFERKLTRTLANRLSPSLKHKHKHIHIHIHNHQNHHHQNLKANTATSTSSTGPPSSTPWPLPASPCTVSNGGDSPSHRTLSDRTVRNTSASSSTNCTRRRTRTVVRDSWAACWAPPRASQRVNSVGGSFGKALSLYGIQTGGGGNVQSGSGSDRRPAQRLLLACQQSPRLFIPRLLIHSSLSLFEHAHSFCFHLTLFFFFFFKNNNNHSIRPTAVNMLLLSTLMSASVLSGAALAQANSCPGFS